MRLNRKWLYLGGLIAILTLLLTLTWALPAGAVGRLDRGNLSTDVAFISPTLTHTSVEESAKLRDVKVTLENSALDLTRTVEKSGDYEAVMLTVADLSTPENTITPTVHEAIVVDIKQRASTKRGTDNLLTVTYPDGVANDEYRDILPITGNLTIDFDADDSVARADVGTLEIVNAEDGIIRIPITGTLSEGEKIHLNYNTSPHETALVNVAGDSGDFDLLTLEESGMAGKYSSTFVAADKVTIKMLDAVDTTTLANGGLHRITHEQHSVPTGLRASVPADREVITKISLTYADGELGDILDSSDTDVAAGDDIYLQVAKPPIRNNNSDASEAAVKLANDGDDITIHSDLFTVTSASTFENAAAGIIKLEVAATKTFDPGDSVSVSYTGSDSFTIDLEHGNILKVGPGLGTAIADNADINNVIAVPAASDDQQDANGSDANDFFAVVGLEDIGTGANARVNSRVRLGVIAGPQRRRQGIPPACPYQRTGRHLPGD